ncbi:MAG: GFA family protein [Gammaproteobacteria bacterium]|nr:GFA family protein [Gammaproteobacteria bacterium]
MNIDGKCHCGEITFRAEVNPDHVIVCHCSDCQALSGSPYRTVVPAVEGTFQIEKGNPKIYVKTIEDGVQRAQAFCPECGSPIYSAPVGEAAMQFIGIRVGLIKQKDQLKPNKQIWCRSSIGWVQDLSDVPRSETE